MRISGLRGLNPFELAMGSAKEFDRDDMMTHACAIAYEVLFSIFPFIIFLIALLGFLELPGFFEWLHGRAQILLPQEALHPVNAVIDEVHRKKSGGLLSFGTIMTIWASSVAMRATMNALNVAHGAAESRPIWLRFPLSIFYTIGIAAMLIAAGILLVVGPQAMQWVAHQVGLEQLFVTLWEWLRWPVGLLLMTLAIDVIYYVAPDVEQEFRFITPGAVLSVIAWLAASWGFNYYIRHFSDYGAVYGSIGAAIVLLMYFFISASILLFGAELNVMIEHHSGERKDSGVYMESPVGRSESRE
ncbi:YihY/virulence factor BrkB family protein [Herbaspirillum sp. HC18]|nr:YihY/virulence factor BrkB family protein [Herbaspirillum sp. HC18]